MTSFPTWYFDESKMAGVSILLSMLLRAGFEIVEANYNTATMLSICALKPRNNRVAGMVWKSWW